MLRFAANLTTMYGALPVLDAIGAAAADGFEAVECRTVFDHPAEQVRDVLAAHGVKMVQFNCPMGNFAQGDRGLTCVPGREAEFRESVDRAIGYATALRVGQVNCVGGLRAAGVPDSQLEDVMVSNLRYAAPRFADAGVRLQIEPINPIDNPGVFFQTTAQFERVYERVASDNLYLQYDFYHLQIVQGDLMRTFRRLFDHINHVQIADNPGRHEPGTGEIDYGHILPALEEAGYTGWIGCEYVPAKGAREGLDWLSPYRLA